MPSDNSINESEVSRGRVFDRIYRMNRISVGWWVAFFVLVRKVNLCNIDPFL